MNALAAILVRDVRKHPASALASIIAVACGVAVFVAIHLAGAAARGSFVDAVEAVAGRATHEITRPGRLPEERFAEIAILRGVRAAQPVVEGRVGVLAIGGDAIGETSSGATSAVAPPLRILGIDPFQSTPFLGREGEERVVRESESTRFVTEPNTVVLPRLWADDAGVGEGDRLVVAAGGRRVALTVLAVYELDALREASRDTAIVDIATAQELLGRIGTLDRIELIVEKGREAEVADALAPGERLERPAQRGARVARMMDAFRLNVVALGGLALVVGSLLVYTAAQFAVVRRSRLLGQLRCIGVSRRGVFGIVIAETALLGGLGGIAGLFGGVALAHGIVGTIGRTVSDLYGFVRAEIRPLEPGFAVAVVAVAAIVALLSGVFPAIDAATTSPLRAGASGRASRRFRLATPRLVVAGFVSAAAGLAMLAIPTQSFWPGFGASLAFLVAGASWLPVVMGAALPLVSRAAERAGAMSLALAAGALSRSLHRAAGSASALAVALAMTLAVVIMVGSFEREVRRWIASVLRADLYVSEETAGRSIATTSIPEEALELMAALPDAVGIDTRRSVEIVVDGRTIWLLGFSWADPAAEIAAQEILDADGDVVQGFVNGGLLVSEPLSQKFGIGAGDTLPVATHRGVRDYPVVAVYRDYSRDTGVAFLTGDAFLEAFGDPGVETAAIHLAPNADIGAAAKQLRDEFAGRFPLRVRSYGQLRDEVFVIFDRTFAVTYALQVIATVMALIGLSVSLVGLFLERAREIATLRAVGASSRVVARLFALESLVLAAFPIVLCVPLGAVLAWIIVDVINLRSFGWSLRLAWPIAPIAATLALALGAALLATAVPWILMRRQSIATSLREE